MKYSFRNIRLIILIFSISVFVGACEYQDIADADYPDQQIYMPASVKGIYYIDAIPTRIGDVPTQGSTYRFVVDQESNKFNIPLGVYRSGVENGGAFQIDILVDTDTISELIETNTLASVDLLPTTAYEIPSNVMMKDGEEVVTFDLSVDLNFLKNSYPDKKFALGVNISSAERESNEDLSTTVVVIDTKIMKSTADFGFSVDVTSTQLINFQNNSLYAVGNIWDFGDGNTSEEVSPAHTFASSGTYSVTLTSTGITGDTDVSVKEVIVDVP